MKYENVYFFNGSAYAGKSTMVKRLAEKYDGTACEENYHESLMGGLDWNEFPNLGYTANLKDWADFIRRTPDEYARWIEDVAKELFQLVGTCSFQVVAHHFAGNQENAYSGNERQDGGNNGGCGH